MMQLPQRLDLPQLQTIVPVAVFLLHLLYGDDFVVMEVHCLEHSTKRTVTEGIFC